MVDIFQTWEGTESKKKMADRLELHYRIYNEIIKILVSSEKIMKKFLDKHTDNAETNCVTLSK